MKAIPTLRVSPWYCSPYAASRYYLKSARVTISSSTFLFGLLLLSACTVTTQDTEVRELTQNLEYYDVTRPYITDLTETVQLVIAGAKLESSTKLASGAKLEEGATLKEWIEQINNHIAYLQRRGSRLEAIDTPIEFQALRGLILESFDSAEKSLAMLSTTYQRFLLPASSERHTAERFIEDRSKTYELLSVAMDNLNKVSNENSRLVDQFEEQLRARGVTK